MRPDKLPAGAMSIEESDPSAPPGAMRAILAPELPPSPPGTRAAITAGWIRDEAAHVRELLQQARLPDADRDAAQAVAADLVRRVRARARDQGVVEAFMRQYDLGSEEGVLLMCVAEALLRIPDQGTADALIRDKLGDANWKRHLGQSDSVLVNASTWGLMLTGKLVDLTDDTRRDVHGAFQRLVGRAGEPMIRLAVRQAMKIMGHQFVLGRSIDEALARSRKGDNAAYRYSFDMLGEGALTTRTRTATSRPTARRSMRSVAPGRSRTCSPRPASRSSCPRCIRATSTPSVPACCPNSAPGCWNSRNWRSPTASA